MRELHLKLLRLGAPLLYLSEESPPEGPGEDDRLYAFDGSVIIVKGPEGPALKRPLPAPRFRGRAADAASPRLEGLARECLALDAGAYRFAQWRPGDFQSIEEGFEEFVRQAWWEGEPLEGDWYLRVLSEDGKAAYQGLRKTAVT